MNIEREFTLRTSNIKAFERATSYLFKKGYKQKQCNDNSVTFFRGSMWRSMFSWSNPAVWPCTLLVIISKDPNYDFLFVKAQFTINTSTQAAVLTPEKEFWDRELSEFEQALLVDGFEPAINKVSLLKVNLAVLKVVLFGTVVGILSGILFGALIAFLAFLIVRQLNWSYEDAKLFSMIAFVVAGLALSIFITKKKERASRKHQSSENKL